MLTFHNSIDQLLERISNTLINNILFFMCTDDLVLCTFCYLLNDLKSIKENNCLLCFGMSHGILSDSTKVYQLERLK